MHKFNDEETVIEKPYCDIFASLNEVLEEKRDLWGRRVQMLVLRPTGPHIVRLAKSELQEIIANLLNNSTQAGANVVCFSAQIHGSELWLQVSDNGWGIPEQVRLGRGFVHAVSALRFAGGTLEIRQPKNGAEILLKIPLIPISYNGADLNRARVPESHI